MSFDGSDVVSCSEFDPDARLEPGVAVNDDIPFDPTDAHPGSEEKIAVMQERCDLGLPLFHPNDDARRIVKVKNETGGFRYIEMYYDEEGDN